MKRMDVKTTASVSRSHKQAHLLSAMLRGVLRLLLTVSCLALGLPVLQAAPDNDQPKETGYASVKSHMTSSEGDAALKVTSSAAGAGVNGPTRAQSGIAVKVVKDNWFDGSAKVGEVDGASILVRQAGKGSDSSGILVDVQNTGLGFLSQTEMTSSILNPTSNTITQKMDIQEGVLNASTMDYLGAVYTATVGKLSTAVQIQHDKGASWDFAIRNLKDGSVNFSVSAATGDIITAGTIRVGASPERQTLISGSGVNTAGTIVGDSVQLLPHSLRSLPSANTPGRIAFCADCRKPSESAGNGTGTIVFDDGRGAWVSLLGALATR